MILDDLDLSKLDGCCREMSEALESILDVKVDDDNRPQLIFYGFSKNGIKNCPWCREQIFSRKVNYVACPSCSQASGADLPVKHLAPICKSN